MKLVAVLGGVGLAALVAVGVVHGQRRTDPALDKIAKEFTAAFNAKDAKKIASFYADDAVLMSPDEPMVKGRGNIEVHYEEEFRVAFSNVQIKPMESVISGTRAFEAGTSSATRPGDASARTENGKYIVIYKRVGNAWKIAYDIYNDDQPPPPPK
jgi:uncharacterized protein (TIGR02246 family)